MIGVGGFIAPRHVKAIKETGNELIIAYDPKDSVGFLDSMFPDALFFTEFERFASALMDNPCDYLVVCSPNYLHFSHIAFGLQNGMNVICEKPLVLEDIHLKKLQEMENRFKKKVFTILQLRYHSKILELKEKFSKATLKQRINLKYITSRGSWYDASWKAIESKSGGVLFNIGIHFFDMLVMVFGSVSGFSINTLEPRKAAGSLTLENAEVNWFLSIDSGDLPEECRKKGIRTFREITIGDENFEFSEGFTDLHTLSYEKILTGFGVELQTASQSINLVNKMIKSKSD